MTDAFIHALHIRRDYAFGIPPAHLARILEYIGKNLDRPIHVADLSELAGMSQSHFSKLFKLSTGLSPHQYVIHERINRSKELLRQGQTKIVDIALEVGFENQAHFTTVFGSVVGTTPRQFQLSSSYDSAGTHPATVSFQQYS